MDSLSDLLLIMGLTPKITARLTVRLSDGLIVKTHCVATYWLTLGHKARLAAGLTVRLTACCRAYYHGSLWGLLWDLIRNARITMGLTMRLTMGFTAGLTVGAYYALHGFRQRFLLGLLITTNRAYCQRSLWGLLCLL